ncbi:MAG TPA: TonB family protein [Terriglobia bacterium]|nr:TonB family protein [Terriglobia bacterium]
MAAPSLAPVLYPESRRRFSRYPIDIALDVIALQSGIPNSMPGRCTDLSEAGLGAVVAGALIAGQPVAIELRLPNVAVPVRARAQVRYQDRLHCGLQFIGLSVEQREKIRYWSSQSGAHVLPRARKIEIAVPDQPAPAVVPDSKKLRGRFRVRRRRFFVLVGFMAMLIALGWWQWQKIWNELEGDASSTAEPQPGLPLRVSPEVMERRIMYQVDPTYPDAARRAGTQGLVILNAVIAPDGTVKRLRPVAGSPLLAQSALNAVQSWKYTPYRAAGQPVEVETTISVNFRLH